MSNEEENHDSPEIISGGKRPHIPRFTVGDSVYYLRSDGSRDGPFLVETAPVGGKCTLCYSDGRRFQNGAKISVDELEEI
ncbi:unnamed protein product [Fusarium equiseti]|uniref:Uncharacterized protein n=1 Tax=Fusarium equiseti TaxID=61235 RepID=A0A8J2IF55_FUSEQ|nr:unnamed protein product [Fusarium equiseti]